jgi:hypothetical protein
MPAEASDRAFTTYATSMLFIPYCDGTAKAQMLMPSCQCWRRFWVISRLLERSAICI